MAEKKSDKGKKQKAKKPGKRQHELYVIGGEKIQRKNKSCPKCGLGTFMGLHKDRVVCGKCHYAEYSMKA